LQIGDRDVAEGGERRVEGLDEGQKERRLGGIRGGVVERRGGGEPGDRLPEIFPARHESLGVAHHELQVIVVEADEPEREGDAEHRPHETIGELRPEQRADERGDEDQRAAHGRRARLEEVGGRAVVAHHLSDLTAHQVPDQRRTDEEREAER